MALKENTTTGKTVKTTLWVATSAAVSAGIVALQAAITNGDLDSTTIAVYLPFVNVGLVALKNLFDKDVANA